MTIRIMEKNKVQISYFGKDYRYISGMTIDGELPIWGGFYEGVNAYYLVWGQENQEESDEAEVIRVVKYDKQWCRLGAASVHGANTVVPFDAGSLRMAEHNGYLYIRTSHKIYRMEDGLRHQTNLTIKVREADMKIVDTAHEVSYSPYGYVSHSFNQFILTDDKDNIVALDQGDAFPRAAMLCKSHIEDEGENRYSGYSDVNTHTYHGKEGDNDTGATVGGLAYSPSNYLTTGTSVIQDGKHGGHDRKYNVYITVTDRDSFDEKNTVFKWITEYGEDGEVSATNPYLMKISANKFILIWSEQEVTEFFFRKTTDTIHYVYIDGEGNLLSEIYTDKGYLSDCEPIVDDGSIIWYVMDNESIAFYKIDSKGELSAGKGQFSDCVDIYPKSILDCRMIFTKIGNEMTYEEAQKSYIIIAGGKIVDKKNYFLGHFLAAFKENKFEDVFTSCYGINEYYGKMDLYAYAIRKNPVLKYVIENGGVKVEWEEERGALGYLIEREDQNGNIKNTEIDDYTVTSWTDLSAVAGMEYQYSIKAFTTDGVKKIYTDSSLKKKIIFGKSASNKSKNVQKKKVEGKNKEKIKSAITEKGIVKTGEQYSDDEYTYKVIKGAKKGGKAQVSISKYRGKEKLLFLRKKYVTLNKVKCQIVSISKKAFYKNNSLKFVAINIPVKSIGESAFKKCKNLRELQIHSLSLAKIHKKAFMGCKKLAVLDLRTNKLTSSTIGRNIVKGTRQKMQLCAPMKKYKQYLKILQKRGNSTIRFKDQ